MPTYDFKCNNCEKNFSVMVAIKDRDKVSCPHCSSGDVKQQISNFYCAGASSSAGSGKKTPPCGMSGG